MSGADETGRRRPRAGSGKVALSDDEAFLWRFVTRSITPKSGKSRVPTHGGEADEAPIARHALPEHPKPSMHAGAKLKPVVSTSPVRASAPAPEPLRPMTLERRKARKIARGGQEIEARLDLHGLTQDEAHRALDHFIRRASRDGLKTVLVITGKGARADENDGHGYVQANRARERGVLRRMVPHWLDGATLRPLVISYAQAHVRHGGEGALYVMLRRS